MALIRIEDYEFVQVNSIFTGLELFVNTFKIWHKTFKSSNFSKYDSRSFFDVQQQQLLQEQFWNGLDGYTRKEVLVRESGELKYNG